MTETIAKIKSTHLGFEGHGIMSLNLNLDYGGSAQGAGGYNLDDPTALGRMVRGVMSACGVEKWEDVAGRTIIAIRDDGYHGLVRGLKPLPTEGGESFMFEEVYEGLETDDD